MFLRDAVQVTTSMSEIQTGKGENVRVREAVELESMGDVADAPRRQYPAISLLFHNSADTIHKGSTSSILYKRVYVTYA